MEYPEWVTQTGTPLGTPRALDDHSPKSPMLHYEEARLRDTDERDAVQKKTFTKWINKHLLKVGQWFITLTPCPTCCPPPPPKPAIFSSYYPPLVFERTQVVKDQEPTKASQGPRANESQSRTKSQRKPVPQPPCLMGVLTCDTDVIQTFNL
ncbi:hypothetical protein V1264_022801 [Littorina saxatilis]|uniref:Calponin-homology (CH) domain-containing protein n=1 Tax=Littorina saxatilis TaxID=31220 RepID=A0AAN9B5X1_9CAEN